MATKQVITPQDLGSGLKVEANKVVVDVQALSLPVDIHLSGVRLDEANKKLIFTFEGVNTPIEVDIATLFGTDTTVSALELAGTTLTARLSNGENRTVDLATLTATVEGRLTTLEGTVNRLTDTLTNSVATLRQELVAKSEVGDTLESLGGVVLGKVITA